MQLSLAQIPGLYEILKCPMRRHLPISLLPVSVRQALMHDRKYMHVVAEAIQWLAQMGLTAFYHRENREKHQVRRQTLNVSACGA